MKLSNENPTKNSLIKSIKLLFLFVLIAAASASVNAQSINDDLQPAARPSTKPLTVKPSAPAAPRPKPVKPVKPVKPKPPVKKPFVKRPTNNTSSAPATPTTATPLVEKTPPVAPPLVAPPAETAPPATPSEIIERFMNFQQSENVTAKDWESVVKQTNQILQSDPSDKVARAQLSIAQGELAFSRGELSNALIQFNGAARIMPDSGLPHYGKGRVYLSTKQPEEAREAFERSVKLNKNFALGYKGLGDAMTAQNKTKKADEYYKLAARYGVAGDVPAGGSGNQASGQTSPPIVVGSQPAVPELSPYDRSLKTARELTAQKKWQKSLETLEPLVKTVPSADLFILMGDNYFGMQAWFSAQQAYRKATEANPNSALAFYKSGLVLFEMNEFQAASESFENALILDQPGTTINRAQARKLADKANEKAKDGKKN